MILDVPTAALDPRAEHEICRKFSDRTEGRMAVLCFARKIFSADGFPLFTF